MPLAAVTFDIWETILIDDSDEPKRAAAGLRTKAAERRQLFWEALNAEAVKDGGTVDKAVTDTAFDMHEAAYRKVWYQFSVTWEVPDRLNMLLDGLGRTLAKDRYDGLVQAFETMELDVMPDLIEGAAGVIADLATRYKLCIISDTIYTPGWGLREILDKHGVKQHFQGFVFSDEAGRSKPHPDCFKSAAEQLDTDFAEMVHIGDRDPKDVAGAQAMGMKAVLFTASRDEGAAEITQADGIAASYAELADVIDRLAAA